VLGSPRPNSTRKSDFLLYIFSPLQDAVRDHHRESDCEDNDDRQGGGPAKSSGLRIIDTEDYIMDQSGKRRSDENPCSNGPPVTFIARI
jgi:hypothetical protein